jgi:23S rRNA (cytidine1920-2'-O)/16S rRNA (cytidine1409-2'-O)-methyltransferase
MIRLDQALVERGLCESRERAKRAILAGQVRVNAQRARKPSDSVRPDDALTLDAGEKYVSRGGHKLEHALRHFQLDVPGRVALDLGASTGGFTDCLLQHGAAKSLPWTSARASSPGNSARTAASWSWKKPTRAI